MTRPIAVSAPGKVLFTGGFLVLDRKYTGLVLGLDARIHVRIEEWKEPRSEIDEAPTTKVLVQSPQFRDAKWLYSISAASDLVLVKQITDNPSYTRSGNKFVETTLTYVLTYLTSKDSTSSGSIKMTIIADESYYSQSRTSSQGRDSFIDFGCKLSDAHKTGLGSSAALVTALTSAMITWYLDTLPSQLSRQLIHNLAQAAHCAAQGKVGSGFDVAAAVFGSCLYRRFSPTILENVGEPTSDGFAERLQRCVDDQDEEHRWDVEVASDAIQVPDGLLLLMCDVDCGSETPGMVRKVLAWRKEKPSEANILWDDIQQASNDLCQVLTRLPRWRKPERKDVEALDDTISKIRSLVREMSVKSNVPVEPQVITELLDFCTALPGVIGGVAPGAGGYDAVALLVKNDAHVVKELENRLDSWKAREEGTGITIGKVQLLKARQANEGVRFERPERYTAWVYTS